MSNRFLCTFLKKPVYKFQTSSSHFVWNLLISSSVLLLLIFMTKFLMIHWNHFYYFKNRMISDVSRFRMSPEFRYNFIWDISLWNSTKEKKLLSRRNVNWLDWSLTRFGGDNWITDRRQWVLFSRLHLCHSRAALDQSRVKETSIFLQTHLILLWFSRRFLMFMFISANFLSSKSRSCECVIFSQILKSGVNLSWRTSTTCENDSIFSHVTMMVLGTIWLGIEQVQGLISRLIEQCSEALAVNENIVYSSVAIVHAFPHTFTQSFIFCCKFWCLWNNYEVFFTTCCNQFPIFQFTFKLSYRAWVSFKKSFKKKIKTRNEF